MDTAVSPSSRSPRTPLQASRWCAEVDPSGDRFHLVAAMLFLALFPLATAPRDIAMAGLVVITVIRAFRIGSAYRSVFVLASTWAILAYFVWMALGLFWTSDVESGLVDIKKHRMLLVPLLLLPVLRHVPWLIGSYLTGVLVVNLLQIMQWLQWPDGVWEPAIRFGAINNPIVTSVFIATAICYWLKLILHGDRRTCLLALPPLCLALFGMMLGLSRGPLLGLAVALPVMVVTTFVLLPPVRRRLGLVVGMVLVALGLVLVAAPSVVSTAIDRFSIAIDEYQEAESDPESSIGIRIQMVDYGLGVLKEHPILGTGPGTASRFMPEGLDLHGGRGDRVTLHNTYLLAAVTLGIPGLLLLLWVLLTCFKQSLPLAAGSGLAGGTLFGLIAWMVAAVGDSFQASGNYLGVFGILLSVSMLGVRSRSTNDPGGTAEKP